MRLVLCELSVGNKFTITYYFLPLFHRVQEICVGHIFFAFDDSPNVFSMNMVWFPFMWQFTLEEPRYISIVNTPSLVFASSPPAIHIYSIVNAQVVIHLELSQMLAAPQNYFDAYLDGIYLKLSLNIVYAPLEVDLFLSGCHICFH